MARTFKEKLGIAALSNLTGYPLLLLSRSWRVETTLMPPETQALLESGQPVIYALWHGRMYSLLKALDPKKVTILVSPSNDGEFIVRAVKVLGFDRVIRGSHKRGGVQAILEMRRELTKHRRSVLFTVDGPRGPRYVVKTGILKLASQTGAPIIPLASSARGLLYKFEKAWDHFHLPAFFTGMSLCYGEPLVVPGGLTDDAAIEPYRQTLEDTLMRLNLEADHAHGLTDRL